MLWVTYRQFRATLLGTLTVIVLLAVVTIVASLALRDTIYASSYGTVLSCFTASTLECSAETALTATTLLTVALPILIGLFVGVTVFSRDIERGTHVLSLSQSVGRLRWYFSRILVIFLPIAAAMTVLGFVFSWTRGLNTTGVWQVASGTSNSRFDYPIFETSALTPGGYTAAALMVGSLIALLLRNTIGAMVLTLAVTVGLLVLTSTVVRQHYGTPLVQTLPTVDALYTGGYADYGSTPRWIVDRNYVDADGNVVEVDYEKCTSDDSYWNETAQRPDETFSDWQARSDELYAIQREQQTTCYTQQGIDHYEIAYYEDSEFWRFQITETLLALILSALACAASVFVVRRGIRPM